MAKISGPFGSDYEGTFGDVTIATVKGRKILRKRAGKRTAPPSGPQKIQQDRFRAASAYADQVAGDPALKQVYAAAAERTLGTWRSAAVQDYFQPPVIARIDVSGYGGSPGDELRVELVDLTVRRVRVRIADPTPGDVPQPEGALGELVEEGAATPVTGGKSFAWVCRAQSDLRSRSKDFVISVEATDHPGNTSVSRYQGTF